MKSVEQSPPSIRGRGYMAMVGIVASLVASAPSRANQEQPITTTSLADIQLKEYGVLTDIAEKTSQEAAARGIDLVNQAGLTALKETVWIATGQQGFKDLSTKDQIRIDNSLNAAEAKDPDMPVTIALWQQGWVRDYKPPLRSTQQRGFCRVGAEIVANHNNVTSINVGVEPNNPNFWRPQFRPDGKDAISKPYLSLLAQCYDQIHRAADLRGKPITVVGEELAASGNDNPNSSRPSHSPVRTILNICKAYKESGRPRPIMDAIGLHWYLQAGQSPLESHPDTTTIGIADYDKVISLLHCFDETAQPMPKIVWDEGGFQTVIPAAERRRYSGSESASYLVDESTQGQYLTDAIDLVETQPNTLGLYNFQLIDDPQLEGWQSGLYYAIPKRGSGDKVYKPKSSLDVVKNAIEEARFGIGLGH